MTGESDFLSAGEGRKPSRVLDADAARYLLAITDRESEASSEDSSPDDSIGDAARAIIEEDTSETLAGAYARTAEHPVLSDSVLNELARQALPESELRAY